MIDQLKAEYPIQVICDVIGYSRSRYYYQLHISMTSGSSELLILLAKYCLTSRWLHQSDELRSAGSRLWNTAEPVVYTLTVDGSSRHQMLQVCFC